MEHLNPAHLDFEEPEHKRLSASERVTQFLRGKIVGMEFPPGTNLSRSEIAAACGVSQTPVRDAFSNLEREGLVEVYPQSRTVVTHINIGSARATQFLRLSIELELIDRLAKDPDKSKIAPAIQAVERQKAILQGSKDPQAFVGWDQAFHRSFYVAGDVLSLWTLVQSQSGHINRMRALQLPQEGHLRTVIRHHEEILDAIQKSDCERAERAVRTHLKGALDAADALRKAYAEYFDA